MLDQTTLDLYVLQGFAGLIRILEARVGPVQPPVKRLALEIKCRLDSLFEAIESSTDEPREIDKARLDKWLITGAATFVQFIEDRAYNDDLPSRFDLPIRAMIQKLNELQKQINTDSP